MFINSLVVFSSILGAFKAQDLFCSTGDCVNPCQDSTEYTECNNGIASCLESSEASDTLSFFSCVGQTFEDPMYDCECVQNQMSCCLETQSEDECQSICANSIIDCVTDTSCIFVWVEFTNTSLDGPGAFFDFNDEFCGNPENEGFCNTAWDNAFECITTECTG